MSRRWCVNPVSSKKTRKVVPFLIKVKTHMTPTAISACYLIVK